jgi:hypothetical protein
VTKAEGGQQEGDRGGCGRLPAREGKIPDVQPDIQAANQSTTPDKAG